MRVLLSVCILVTAGCMGSGKFEQRNSGLTNYLDDHPDCDVDADGDIDGDDRHGAPHHCAGDVAFCYMAHEEGCLADGNEQYTCDDWELQCGGGGRGDPVSDDAALIRVVHAAPDAPAVDVWAAGVPEPLLRNVAFGETTEYLAVTAGSYDVEIRPAGAAADEPPVYRTGPLDLPGGARITAVAAGLLAAGGDQAFRVLPLVEGFEAPTEGAATVRIVHASADAPAVALDVGDDGSAEIQGLGRFEDTGAAGVALPAGTALQIGVLAGDPLSRVTAFSTPELPEGAELFVIATGLLDRLAREPDGLSLLAVSAGGSIGLIRQNPVVFALHAGPDAPAVSIFAGDAQIVDRISFGEISSPIQVPPGEYSLAFFAVDPDSCDDPGGVRPEGHPAASATTPLLEAGERYLAIATGFLHPEGHEAPFQLLAQAESFALGDDNARVRAVHASADAPAVDVSTVDDGRIALPLLVSDLSFGDATAGEGLSVPAATLPIGVAAAGSLEPVATFHVTTSAGGRAFLVAAGALAPDGSEEAFRLLAVDTSIYPWAAGTIQPQP